MFDTDQNGESGNPNRCSWFRLPHLIGVHNCIWCFLMEATGLILTAYLAFGQNLPSPGPGTSIFTRVAGESGPTLVASVLCPPGTSDIVTSQPIDLNPGSGAADGVYVWATGVMDPNSTIVSDNKGNVYIRSAFISGYDNATLWYVDNGTGLIKVDSSFTVSIVNCVACAWGVVAMKGMKTTDCYDGIANNIGTAIYGSNTIQLSNINPGSGKHLIFVIVSGGGTTSTWSIDSGFTILQSRPNASGLNYDGAVAYLVQAPNGTTVSPIVTFGSSGNLVGDIVSFGAR